MKIQTLKALENSVSVIHNRIAAPYLTLRHCSRRVLLNAASLMICAACVACVGGRSTSSSPTIANSANAVAAASPNLATTTTESMKQTAFDGERAFTHVKRQVEFGARPAGSPELANTRDYLIKQLRDYGLTVTTQEFRTRTPIGDRTFVNIIADLPGASDEQLILASHYDTKFYKNMRFVGANDGASSTGVLIEMARVLKQQNQQHPLTVRFLFFDGEEAFCENWTDCKSYNASGQAVEPDNTYGSRHYVKQAVANNELAKIRALILLDLVGYKELKFPRDANSTAWLTDIIWRTGRELGHGKVFVDEQDYIEDDHTHFLQAGVNAVDIIQLGGYPHWHKESDTLDKISARSLQIVGETVLKSLPRIEERLARQKR